MPVELYERDGDDRVPAVNHPLYNVIKYSPNQWQTPFEYQESIQISVGLRGNSYSFIERDTAGSVVALYPLDSGSVIVMRGADGAPFYSVNGSEPLPARFIHHVRWISRNGYTGLSPVELHANTIGYAQAIHKYANKSFLNGTALSGVIERPKDAPPFKNPSDVDKITDDWSRKFSGSENVKKVALLQEGMSFKPLQMTNVDAQLIDSIRLSAIDIARIYKIPAHMVGELEHATFSNIEHQAIQFVIYTLLPWIKRHEQARCRDFLLPSERKKYFIEYNVGGLLRGDLNSRYGAYAVGRQWGWLSANDIRRLENMPPIAGGDAYLSPLNMSSTSDFSTMPPDQKNAQKAQIDDITRILV